MIRSIRLSLCITLALGLLACDPYGRHYRGVVVLRSQLGYHATTWDPVIDELLDTPAPTQDWRPFARYQSSPPPDSVSDEVLIAWWATNRLGGEDKLVPSADVLRRLHQAMPRYPTLVRDLMYRLPVTRETCDRIAAVVATERQRPDTPLSSNDFEQFDFWLERRTPYTVAELEDKLKKISAPTNREFFRGDDLLDSLLERAPDRAMAMLEKHAASPDITLASWARGRLLDRMVASGDERRVEGLRRGLKALAVDTGQPPYARSQSIAAVMKHDWPGRDDWFMSLYLDPTLADLEEGGMGLNPLGSVVYDQPDRLVPRVAALLGHETDHVHDLAADSLIYVKHPGALRALLPWIEDPTWIRRQTSLIDGLRSHLLNTLAEVPVAEAIPTLIHVVRNDSNPYNRSLAATALAALGDAGREGITAIGEAVADELHYRYRMPMVQALARMNALSVADVVTGVSTYTWMQRDPESRRLLHSVRNLEMEGSHSVISLSIGFLAIEELDSFPDALADAVVRETHKYIRRIVYRGQTEWAAAARRAVAGWKRPTMMRQFISDLGNRELDAVMVRHLLEERADYVDKAGDALRELVKDDSEASAIAAVMLGDDAAVEKLLSMAEENDRSRAEFMARRQHYLDILHPYDLEEVDRIIEDEAEYDYRRATAVLAAARLTRHELDVAQVARYLDHENERLARAAERYLVALDSASAREVLYRRHDAGEDGGILILGARETFDPRSDPDDAFAVKERQLVEYISKDRDIREIHALIYFSEEEGHLLAAVLVRNRSATLLKDGKERELTSDEKRDWMALISELRVTELPALTHGDETSSGLQLEFVHLTRKRGRRVFMVSPGRNDWASPYHQLLLKFYYWPMP